MPERGQSELLGFASMFAVVLFMIFVVSTAIYPAMESSKDHHRVAGVERGFESLADNIDDLVRNDASSRTTRLRLLGGHLSLGEPVNVTVNGTSADGGGEAFTVSHEVRPLVYRSGAGAEIVYATGAVVRDDGHGVVMLEEPDLLLSENRTVFPIVQLRVSESQDSVGGRSTVTVESIRTDTLLTVAEPTPHEINVSVSSPRADAWRRTLEANEGVTCTQTDSRVMCTMTTRRVYVSVVQVDVTFR